MTYGVVARAAVALNAAKGRAPDHSVAVSMHDPAEREHVLPGLDLPPAARARIGLLLARRLTVLVPVRPDVPVPAWMSPALRDGRLMIFDGSWAPTATLWRRFPRLFGSSANRTGGVPARSAAEARAALGRECFVIEGDAPRMRAASTIVRFDRLGRLGLHRSGAQDQERSEMYLRQLAELVGVPLEEP